LLAGGGQLIGGADQLSIPHFQGGRDLWRETATGLSKQNSALSQDPLQVLTNGCISRRSRDQNVIEISAAFGRAALYERQVIW
jgi:hypothetical protein